MKQNTKPLFFVPNPLCSKGLNPWVMPSCPWERLHLDFAGTFQGSMFLISVDAHSKWPEVHIMPNTTVPRTLDSLRYMFAAYRLPSQTMVLNFISQDLAVF